MAMFNSKLVVYQAGYTTKKGGTAPPTDGFFHAELREKLENHPSRTDRNSVLHSLGETNGKYPWLNF